MRTCRLVNYTGRKTPSYKLELDDLSIWFSYETPVAFHVLGESIVIRENDWGPTTGRHLADIDGGRSLPRVSGEEFEQRLQEALSLVFGGSR